MSVRPRWALLAGATAIASISVGAAAATAAAPVPNPCTIVTAATVSSAVRLNGVILKGTASTRADGPVKQSLCTFKHGSAVLEILIAPHLPSGGFGGPPGMVITKPSGLGTGATFAYDQSPKYEFGNVSFTKGAFDGGVWDNGKYPPAEILALARTVYKAFP